MKYLIPFFLLIFVAGSDDVVEIPAKLFVDGTWFADAKMSIPTGKQTLDGVEWQITERTGKVAAVVLRGNGAAEAPAEAPGIPVNAAPGVIHFLHTFNPGPGLDEIESKKKGPAHPPQVFRYRFNYKDGAGVELHLDWRHHVAPWHDTKQKPASMYIAHPAWTQKVDDGWLAVYRTSIVNPRPTKEIASIDMLGPEEKYQKNYGSPALLAISTGPMAVTEVDGQAWSVMDYCQSQGEATLQYDSEKRSIGVPFHCKSDRGGISFRVQPVKGDFVFTARLINMPLAANWAFAGITARPSILFKGRGGAEFGPYLYFKPAPKHPELERKGIFYISDGKPLTGGVAFGDNSTSLKLENQQDFKTPIWLKMERKGDDFLSFHSSDGKAWTVFKTITVKDCPEQLFLGLYGALSHGPEMLHATFDNVEINVKHK